LSQTEVFAAAAHLFKTMHYSKGSNMVAELKESKLRLSSWSIDKNNINSNLKEI
ncbi:13470_t:CDS:1, partial [Racocetra persica]